MSPQPTHPKLARASETVEAGIDRVTGASDDESESPLTGIAKELFDVLVATNALVRTIDLEKLPDVVNVEELPPLVDLDRLSDAIAEHDPDLFFDLSHLERVVNRRELWDSVDLLEFAKAERRLDRELEDVLGADDTVESASQAVTDAKEFADSLRSDAKQALVQQELTEKVALPRQAIGDQHAALERLYASNKERIRNAQERRGARNPTAVSLHPTGPLPDGISTRLSTVSSEAPHTKTAAIPRIYGRRWRSGSSRTGR